MKSEQRIYDAERRNGRADGANNNRDRKSRALVTRKLGSPPLSARSPRSVKESKRECQVRLRRTTMRNKGGTDADAPTQLAWR